MNEARTNDRNSTRLRRLFQVLLGAAVLWIVVFAVRWFWPASHLQLAHEAVNAGHFDVAVENYLNHLTSKPTDWGARLELGYILAKTDRPQALEEFRKVPPESEEYLAALRQIAQICLASERLSEAEQALLKIKQLDPDDPMADLLLAGLYFRQFQPATALPHIEAALDKNPEAADAYFLHAEILDELDRSAEMIASLRKVLQLQPDSYAAHLNLSYALVQAGQFAEAGREARWCLARNPADVNARRFLALAHRDAGQRKEAMQEIQRALELQPDDIECRLVEAELLLFDRKSEQAWQRLSPLYEQHQDDRRLAALLARAAAASGREQEAAEYRRRVQELSE